MRPMISTSSTKGTLTETLPETDRRVSDRSIDWFERLKDRGLVETTVQYHIVHKRRLPISRIGGDMGCAGRIVLHDAGDPGAIFSTGGWRGFVP